jgi:hypothetical protein
MALSPANVIQQKTGSAVAATAAVALDAGTRQGSTVTVEIWCGGVPITNQGLQGRVPDGFETDAYGVDSNSNPILYVFRKRGVAAGEGVAGATSWDFTYIASTIWCWRVTEWDTGLEPVFPLEAVASNFATGTGATAVATGTTPQTSRANTVCLAWHHWQRVNAGVPTFSWSAYDSGFVERDQLRGASGTTEYCSAWSWLFNTTVGQYSCTATNTVTPSRSTSDVYFALLVVYAATT